VTSWSRRLNAAERRPGLSAARARLDADGQTDPLTSPELDGVIDDDLAVLRALVTVAGEREGFRRRVPVTAERDGRPVELVYEVAHGEEGPTVRAVGAPVEPEGPGAGPLDVTAVLTRTLVETPDLVAVFSSVGHEAVWANDAFASVVPVRAEDKVWLVELLDEWSKGHYEVKVLPALVKYGRWRGYLTLRGVEGERRVSSVIVAHRDDRGEIDAVSLVARDTPGAPADQPADALEVDAGARFAALVENPTEIIVVCDLDGAIRYASPGAVRLLGGGELALDGSANVMDRVVGGAAPASLLALVQPDEQGVGVPVEVTLEDPEGSLRHLEVIVTDLTDNPAIRGLVLNARDVTDRVEAANALVEAAYTDALTGLPNRVRLLDRLAEQGESGSPACAVLMVDLDRFGTVNSQLGTEASDQVLAVVAERLVDAVAEPTWVARHSGDQFVVVAPGVEDPAEAIRLAGRLRAAITGTVRTDRGAADVAASVGVTLVHEVADPESVLLEAGRALTHAKETGRDRVEVYSPQLAAVTSRRQVMEAQLRHALEHDGVALHYQPIVAVGTRAMVAAEALLRVRDTDGVVLNPAELIEAAASAGLMTRLGGRVLEATAAQLASWQHVEGAPRALSINLSPRQLADPDLPARVAEALRAAGVEPEHLWLELSESILISPQPTVDAAISYLRALGVRIGLDDFGAGRSSLGYLKRFPLDFVKIDRSLVAGLGTDDQDTAIVRATIELAHNLGLQAVAVGVETEEQLAVLELHGCDCAQGFLFSPPVPPGELG
jgi:diguanylate cyclase (GGDEF)-like protein/PAS domain S-box-containing protein